MAREDLIFPYGSVYVNHRALFQISSFSRIKMEDVSVRFWREVVRFEIKVDALPTWSRFAAANWKGNIPTFLDMEVV